MGAAHKRNASKQSSLPSSIFPDYALWLDRPHWSQSEALWMLLGLDPSLSGYERPLPDEHLNYALSSYEHVYGRLKNQLELYQAHVFDFCFTSDRTLEQARNFQSIDPNVLLQWCFDRHIPWSWRLQKAINERGIKRFRFSDNAPYIHQLEKLSRRDGWTPQEAVKLVTGISPCQSDERLKQTIAIHKESTGYCQSMIQDLSDLAETAFNSWRTGSLPVIDSAVDSQRLPQTALEFYTDPDLLLKPKPFIDWAISKGVQPPDQLLEIMAMQTRKALDSGSYLSPYMELMHRAVKELHISRENQPLKKTIEAWFEGQTIHGERLSQRTISALASFVREQEQQKGGSRS